jgi:uncharacterized membrane protein
MSTTATLQPPASPDIHPITLDHPWHWLEAGWRDFLAAPSVGLVWGVAFTLIGLILSYGLDWAGLSALIVPLGLGFVLLGPAAAVGLYETSRRLERGEAPGLVSAFRALSRNPAQIGLAGVFLALAFAAWIWLAILEFMLVHGAEPFAPGGMYDTLVTDPAGAPLLVLGTLTGAALGAGVFAMTAVALPLLIDRPDCDAMTAMLTSLAAVRRNWRPMALWASIIGMATLAGLAVFLLGLIVVLPVLGHASWHAYRDLVPRDPA